MSKTVECCPECESANFNRIVGGNLHGGLSRSDKNYFCNDCEHTFDDPAEKVVHTDGGLKGLSKQLAEMNPEDL